MEKIKFFICDKEYYFKDTLIFSTTTDLKNNLKINQNFIKICRDKNNNLSITISELSDDELLNNMVVKKLPKPKTFPKFNNETSFKINFNRKLIINPKIISIRWTGYIWEYQVENIGHKYDYQPENLLIIN